MFTHPEGTYLCVEITVECLTYILSADDGVDSFFPEGKLLYCLFVVYCCRFFFLQGAASSLSIGIQRVMELAVT